MVHSGSPSTPRGRPREFDMEAVVERAMGAFWSSGYHGTSLPDLLEATKLSRGSLYAAFGDKHGLFLRALDRYIDEALARAEIELDPAKDALAGVRLLLSGYVDRATGAAGARGCLVVATAMELAAHDAAARQRVARFFGAMEAQLTAALTRARSAGHLAPGIEPAAGARLLLCLVEGMRVVGKTGRDRAGSEAVIQTLIDRLVK